MAVKVIAAVDLNYLMGYDNHIPWNIPSDLKRFRQKTLNHIVVMGRKTYESIGKPLPDRTNCVISSDFTKIKNLSSGIILGNSLNEIMLKLSGTDKTIWVIGGSQVYKDAFAMDIVSEIDLTILNGRWMPPATDALELKKQKSVFFPRIPLEFTVESEEKNKDDASLLHRRYVKSYW